MFSQYGELRLISVWDRFISLGYPRKFQWVSGLGFITVSTSLNGGQPNCTTPSPGLLRYIGLYIFGGSCPLREFFRMQNSRFVQRYCTALQQRASAKLCSVVQGMELRNFRRRRHLYWAGRPSRWASAHILVINRLELDIHICNLCTSHILL